MTRTRLWFAVLAVTCLAIATATILNAVVPPQTDGVRVKAFRKPGLFPAPALGPADASALAALGVRPGQAFRDTRTGGWGSIILQHELLSDAGSGQDSVGDRRRREQRVRGLPGGERRLPRPRSRRGGAPQGHGARRRAADPDPRPPGRGRRAGARRRFERGPQQRQPRPLRPAQLGAGAGRDPARGGRRGGAGRPHRLPRAIHPERLGPRAAARAGAVRRRQRLELPPGVGLLADLPEQHGHLGRPGRRDERRGARLPRPQPVRHAARRRGSRPAGCERQPRPRRHRAAGMADALRRPDRAFEPSARWSPTAAATRRCAWTARWP